MNPKRKGVFLDVGNVLIRYQEDQGLYHLAGMLSRTNGRLLDAEEIATAMKTARTEAWPAAGVADLEDHVIEQAFRASLRHQDIVLAKDGGKALFHALTDCFSPIPERLALLAQLQQTGVFVALVTDTVSWHWRTLIRIFPILANVPSIRSYAVGQRKEQGAGIYRITIEQLGIPANQVGNLVMVDDRADNLPGAEELGIKGLHVQPDDDLAVILEAEGVDLTLRQPARLLATA